MLLYELHEVVRQMGALVSESHMWGMFVSYS